ncbi:MAG TPA: hypothetical protein VN848_12440 [Gemmatimonadales bacterium]|nr:hypothetical protein [Gemmatimonadales bacterium]
MTNEQLHQKYKFLKQVAQEGGRSFHALDPSGRVVMVHVLADPAEASRVLKQLDRFGMVDRRRIVERTEVEGSPVIVTEFIQGFTTFAAWVQARVPAGASPTTGPGAPPAKQPGEVTDLFGPSGAAGAAQTIPVPRVPPERSPTADGATELLPSTDLSQPAPAADLGRGTQPLRAVPASRPPTASPTPQAPPPAPPGGMTQLFGAPETTGPTTPQAPTPPQPASPRPSAGMTGLFGGPASDPPPAKAPEQPSAPKPPAKPAPPEGSGMTQLFGGTAAPATPVPPPAPPPTAAPPAPPPATPSAPKPTVHWRETPKTPQQTPQPPAPPRIERPVPPASPPARSAVPPPAPPPPPAAKPAGEFTRLFGSGGADQAPPTPSVSTGPRQQNPASPANVSPPGFPPVTPPPAQDAAPRPPGAFTQAFSQPKAAPPPLTPQPSDRDYRAALSSGPDAGTSPFGPPAPPPPAPKQAGEFTQLMAGSLLSPTTPPPAAPPRPGAPPSPPPPTPARSAGPGEFTRIVSASAPPPQPPKTTPPPSARPAPKARPPAQEGPAEDEARPPSRLVLVLALGLLGLTALALILYVVLRAKS